MARQNRWSSRSRSRGLEVGLDESVAKARSGRGESEPATVHEIPKKKATAKKAASKKATVKKTAAKKTAGRRSHSA
ncbi:hypothetical protein [Streptomyces sp. NPDC056730]|uniref:hypothetical protein n=1 Tax=unclassified Streptomyces TaxID=2593676 RepID=UPI003689C319